MTISEKINAEFITAFKGGEKAKKTFLGLIKGEIQNNTGRGIEANDANVTKIIVKLNKSLTENQKNGDASAETELEWLAPYLPQLMTESETERELHVFLSTADASEISMPGIMKYFNMNFKGKVDNRIVSKLAKASI